MRYEIVTLESKTVTGINCRTSNSDPEMALKIGGLWRAYFSKTAEKIPNRISSAAMGVYANYESDYAGAYDLLVGCETGTGKPLAQDMQTIVIPAGTYAKFTFHGDAVQDAVKFWQEIWSTDLDRAYICDFEEYLQETDAPQMTIHIYIGLTKS